MDEDAVERIRGQIVAGIRIDQEDPEKVASHEWFKLAFVGHPYAQPIQGTPNGGRHHRRPTSRTT